MVTLHEVREAQYRHARHYLEQLRITNEVYQGGGDRVWQLLAQFHSDWEQIERGQSWAAQQGDDVRAANLCNDYPLVGSNVLSLHQTVADRIIWLEAALVAAVDLDLVRPQCAHLCALGRAYWEAGDVDRAKEALERARLLAEDLDDPVNLALAHYELGYIAEKQADLDLARHHTQVCLDLYTDLADRRGIAQAMQQFARIYAFESNYAEAERYALESLDLFREIGDHQGLANTLTQLGVMAGNQQNTPLAEQYYTESYDISCQLGDLAGQGQTLRLLGVCASFQGNYPLARQRYEASLAVYQRLGHRSSLGEAYRRLGESYQYSGEYEQALGYYEQALDIFRTLQALDDVASTLLCMGNTIAHFDRAQAIQWMIEAQGIFRAVGKPRMLAAALGQLGEWTSERGEFDQAEAYFTEAMAAAEVGGDPWVMAIVLFDRSKLERLRGIFDAARVYWCRGFELTVGFRAPGMLTEGMTYLCEILFDSAQQLELAYELAYFVVEHPSEIGAVKDKASGLLAQLDDQLTEDGRQAAIARAQARDLDTYCDLLQSECASW